MGLIGLSLKKIMELLYLQDLLTLVGFRWEFRGALAAGVTESHHQKIRPGVLRLPS